MSCLNILQIALPSIITLGPEENSVSKLGRDDDRKGSNEDMGQQGKCVRRNNFFLLFKKKHVQGFSVQHCLKW